MEIYGAMCFFRSSPSIPDRCSLGWEGIGGSIPESLRRARRPVLKQLLHLLLFTFRIISSPHRGISSHKVPMDSAHRGFSRSGGFQFFNPSSFVAFSNQRLAREGVRRSTLRI